MPLSSEFGGMLRCCIAHRGMEKPAECLFSNNLQAVRAIGRVGQVRCDCSGDFYGPAAIEPTSSVAAHVCCHHGAEAHLQRHIRSPEYLA